MLHPRNLSLSKQCLFRSAGESVGNGGSQVGQVKYNGVGTGELMKGKMLSKAGEDEGALAWGQWVQFDFVFRGGGDGYKEVWNVMKWAETETLFEKIFEWKQEEITCFWQRFWARKDQSLVLQIKPGSWKD